MPPLLYLLLWITCLSSKVASLSVDGVALITFKKKLISDPYNTLGDWNVSEDTPCSWTGVICDNVPPSTFPRVVGLTVTGKELSGPLSPALGALDALQRLNLQGNNLTGTIPSQLFNATSLVTILVADNHITGHLPPEIGHLRTLQTLDLSNNQLSGNIPKSITKCTNLQTLVLAKNNFSGPIPRGFGSSFTSLEQLDLSANHLSGAIPDDLGNLSSLQGTLNLSYNHLSGAIPDSLGKLPYFVSLDFSYNNLSGKIPQDGSLANQGPGPFVGNPRLCGFPLDNACHVSPPLPSLPTESSPSSPSSSASSSPAKHHQNNIPKKSTLSVGAIVGIAVGDAVGISMVAVLLMYWYWKTRASQEKKASSSSNTATKERKYGSRRCFNASSEVSSEASGSPEKVREQGELVPLDKNFSSDLDELLRASAYVLGKSGLGIVYKVVLGSGNPVAVRRLGEGGIQRQKEFESEVQAIGKVKHPNVVRLLAYYWAVDEKLLIYDFIPYGSLAAALHGPPKSQARILSWTERLKILEGVAKGLAHIHDCSPRKHVHGDIKTSKILLGPDNQAYVSDFGLWKLTSIAAENSTGDWSSSSTATLRVKNSSSFYRAPEAMPIDSKPTQKWDVYSFGVVTMEVLSGRSPAVQMATAGVDMVAWMRNAIYEGRERENLLDPAMADAPVIREGSGVSALLDLAMACTSHVPDQRPRMKSVADAIHKIST